MEETPEPVDEEPLGGEEIELSGGIEAPLETEDEAFADLAEGGPEELEVTDLGEAEELSAGPAMDEVLYEIFSKEARDHLDAINEFIAQAREADGDSRVSEGLIRALHTLTGSARMADVHPIAELGRKMEVLVQTRHEAGAGLDSDELELLARGAALVDEIVTALGEAGAELPDVNPLVSELQERAEAAIRGRRRRQGRAGAGTRSGSRAARRRRRRGARRVGGAPAAALRYRCRSGGSVPGGGGGHSPLPGDYGGTLGRPPGARRHHCRASPLPAYPQRRCAARRFRHHRRALSLAGERLR